MNQESAIAGEAKANRLAREKSPYLLQHQFNPVDWHAWGEEAFAAAKQLDRPIFLSIGYSTCHWCHVMERESFENDAVARFLNNHFVSIKVDREERPDIDKIYMTFVQATTGQGGWPLSAFLTPDRKPFFGGTYFPPESHYGRPGFLQLLHRIDELWRTRRGEIAQSAAQIHSQIEQANTTAPAATGLDQPLEILRHAGRVFKESYDARHGGFGGAPKFPQPSQPQFLLRYSRRFHDEEAARMVLHTCERMAEGGIHDQLGGGFSRYSVDAEWLVPHFEKMLYDNAQLAQLYLDAYLVSGAEGTRAARHAQTARDILDYVLRDMSHPEGGFYSAEDADSEGHEGKFYCWTLDELSKLLDPEEFKVTARYFGVTAKGNFTDHSHPHPLAGQNVLSIVDGTLSGGEFEILKAAKSKMMTAREQRVRPHLDDKVLASWNGLMLGAMARASAVLDEPRYRQAAEKNLAFLQDKLWDPATGTLYHRWRDGERDSVQLLDAYAFLLAGVIDLYEVSLDPKHLDFALALADALLDRFYDRLKGGFWQTASGVSDLILRLKEDYDGAEPSGNSVVCLAFLKLGRIAARTDLVEAAEKTLRSFAARLEQLPQAVPYLLQALDFSLQEPARAVIAGRSTLPETQALVKAIHSVYHPNKVVLGNAGQVESFARTLPSQDGGAVYVCTGTACQAPTNDPVKVKDLLSS